MVQHYALKPKASTHPVPVGNTLLALWPCDYVDVYTNKPFETL